MIQNLLLLVILAAAPPTVTFNKDIAPIIYKNCASCHRPGEVAPFSLLTYSDVAKRAKQIATVTSKRFMPPWKPEPGFGDFQDVRRLSDDELHLLQQWAADGAPEGDAKLKPTPPQFQDGWQLGKPDLIVQMSEAYTVPAEGRDIYRCFVIPLNLTEDRFVSAIEFRPGNRKVVHHAILHTEQPGPDRDRDAADPGPGYNCFGGGGGVTGEGGLGGWVPGASPRFLPDEIARPIAKGADLIVQNHYHPDGKPETDQSSIGIYFAKNPPTKTVLTIPLVQRNLSISAGDAHYKVEASFTTPIPLTVINIAPHMHLLGREMSVTAVLPDGSERPMIRINDWDFNWQGNYSYREPLLLPAGTRINMVAYYDNSAANPRNPNDPPKLVRWGEQTTDEMSIAFIQCVLSSARERQQLLAALAVQLRNQIPTRALRNNPLRSPATVQALFTVLSGGKDTISREQFKKFLDQYPQVPAALFDLLDTNSDGVITNEEFQGLIRLLGGGG